MRYVQNFLAIMLLGMIATAAQDADDEATAKQKDYPVKSVPFTAVKVKGFWSERIKTARSSILKANFDKCEETGRIDNFAKAGGLMEGPFRGIYFDDSDVFKAIEGASYAMMQSPDPKMDAYLDDLIKKIAAAQEDDGYLYTARSLVKPERMHRNAGRTRWSRLADSHELYNMGHMIEAGVAHFEATGKKSLLNVAIKSADMMCEVFGPGKRVGAPGHQEIELALVRLYRVTKKKEYLDLAKFFLDIRGRESRYSWFYQANKPLLDQRDPFGHTVRGLYMYCGVTDIAALTGEKKYEDVVRSIWKGVIESRMMITGGMGFQGHDKYFESFSAPWMFPERPCDVDTCTVIATVFWAQRLQKLSGADSQYGDVIERIIHNRMPAGYSLDGTRFTYGSPMMSIGKDTRNAKEKGILGKSLNDHTHFRKTWLMVACCPPNIARFVPSIGQYIYYVDGDSLIIDQYVASEAEFNLGKTKLRVKQETDYPWDGKIRIQPAPKKKAEFAVKLRIPGWAREKPFPSDLYKFTEPSSEKVSLTVNGKKYPVEIEKGFVTIHRKWGKRDVIELTLPMPVRRIAAHKYVSDLTGKVALQRGPVLYCLEGVDHDGKVLDLTLPSKNSFTAEMKPDLLGGVMVLNGKAKRKAEKVPITAVPYYAWDNRNIGEMRIWLPDPDMDVKAESSTNPAMKAKPSVSFENKFDKITAVNDGKVPTSSRDHSIPRFTWWPNKGGVEWVQLDFEKPTSLSAAEVYWFDDGGRGECRAPESWRLLYLDGEKWKPVKIKDKEEFGVAIDKFNRAAFKTVKTKALRVEVQLKENLSSGVLEWRVEEK